MDTDAFQKPDRFGGPPKVQLDDQDRPQTGKVVKAAKSGGGAVASVAKSAGGGGGGAAKVHEGLVMEKFRGDPKGENMFKQIGF